MTKKLALMILFLPALAGIGQAHAQAPVIEAGDITSSSNNTDDSTPDVSYPAYVSGDLLIQIIGVGNDLTEADLTAPATGPNGETLILSDIGSGGNGASGPMQGIVAWVGNATISAGDLVWTIGRAGGEQWGGRTIKVPAGEFNASDPLGALSGYGGNSSPSNDIPTPAWSAGASDGGGRIIVGLVTDIAAISGTPTGWTLLANTDHGAVAVAVAVRDAATTNSESIASVNYTTTNETSSTIGIIALGQSLTFTAGPSVDPATNGYKWPKAGDWINYDPSVIIGWDGWRPTDSEETILSQMLRDKFNSITADYRIRPFQHTGDYLESEPVGGCMEDFIPPGMRLLIAMGAQPVSGDIVYVKLSEHAEAQFNRYAKAGLSEPVTPGVGSIKIYYQTDGREILMNAWQATMLADNEILGVVRYAMFDHKEVYVSPLDPGPRPFIP